MNSELTNLLGKISTTHNFQKEKIQQLCEDTDSETVLKILIQFNETLKQSIITLEVAINSNDVEPIWKAAHKIAGSAELLGFVDYGIHARNLSHHLRQNPDFIFYINEVSHFFANTKLIQKKINDSLL